MEPLELARKLAEYKKINEAQKAYTVALEQGGLAPEEELEAATYLFASEGDYKAAYTTFVSLFNRGFFQSELLDLMSQAFYFPNVSGLQKRYQDNCALLRQYPYCFRTDFPPFEELPIWFFPFDDHSYIPYFPQDSRFGDYVDFDTPVIDRYFFRDLENPILAKDVTSQYQLEYLNDTVRKSEWVGRENHIYLHYTSWPVFCAYLQCLDLRQLLKEEKFVFLFEEELGQYPIDFKARFGIDYSQYPMKPVGVREINRLIWHTQLAAHNGGDFFNQVLYGHPNLLALESVMMEDVERVVKEAQKSWKQDRASFRKTALYPFLASIKDPGEKDFMVAFFLSDPRCSSACDRASRIAPALLFQPHFPNMIYEIHGSEDNKQCILCSEQYEEIRKSPFFKRFKYIKTFTPMRRITTSYAASNRFAYQSANPEEEHTVIKDLLTTRLLNRSFMIDPTDRLYWDSAVVRYEDGKLNPKATFTALAEFLDIPYTKSMEICTMWQDGGVQESSVGFDPAGVYRTYDDYADDADRAFLEYFLRDAYDFYGYDFHYYKGETADEAWIEQMARGAVHLDGLIEDTFTRLYKSIMAEQVRQAGADPDSQEGREKIGRQAALEARQRVQEFQDNRIRVAKKLQMGLRFVNRDGQPLKMAPLLKLDPALLERPLYR